LIEMNGKNWSFPVLTAGQFAEFPRMLFAFRPQSRLAGVTERSSLTRVGPIHVTPPSVDL
jgi:hypothetical protein